MQNQLMNPYETSQETRPMKKKIWISPRGRKHMEFLKFILPALVLYAAFFLIPLLQTIGNSFTSWNGISANHKFIGFENYAMLFKDNLFLNSMKFTILYTVVYTICVNVLGFLFALLLNKKLKSKTLIRAIIFAPFVFNNVTVGFLWQFILGRFMNSLFMLTGWKIFEISWLGDSRIVLFSVVFVQIWQSLGFFMVIYLAGLQMIPKDPIEAALIDGVGRFGMIRTIILPLLSPTIAVCMFFATTEAIQIFPLLMTLTSGGPGHATESISLYIYNVAFNNQQMGYASSISVVLAICIIVITYLQFKVFGQREAKGEL